MAESHTQVVEKALRAALDGQLRSNPAANGHFLEHYVQAAMAFWRLERSSGRTESMKQQAFQERIETLGRMLREAGKQP